jgi:hypothetical protein
MATRDLIEAKIELARQGFLPSGAERERLRAFARSLEWKGTEHDADDATRSVREAGLRSRKGAWQALGSSGVAGVLTVGGALALGLGLGFAWGRHTPAPAPSSERPVDLAQGYEAPATAAPDNARSVIAVADGAPVSSASNEAPSTTPAPGADIESASPSLALPPPAIHPQQRAPSMPSAASQGRQATSSGLVQPRAPHATGKASEREPVDGELALLGRTEWALRHGDTASALEILAELERRYPHSAFAEERAGAQTMARCQAKLAGAREDGERFLRERPNSVYAARVRYSCQDGR